MDDHDLSAWAHAHRFDAGNAAAERGTRWVTAITLAMMVVEIVAGGWFNSMALLADGFHMASHAVAIGMSAFAYAAARWHVDDRRYAFGTWKIEVLAGFASAMVLLLVVGLMAVGSIERLITPQPIHYLEAIVIAAVGLVVNLVCALILAGSHAHDHHGHGHDHGHSHAQTVDHRHDHHDHDLNLKSAYVHVLADAATSVAAIGALLGGWFFGWAWLDAATGLGGAVIVALWAKSLLMQTSAVLLDREMDSPVVDQIRRAVAEGGVAGNTLVADLHVWRVGKANFSCAISVVTHDRLLTPDQVRAWFARHAEVVHSTVEINQCQESHGGEGAASAEA
jgi:cation diffusion facilitator family transporter